MIIPSIDLMDGHAVQLVGGKEKVLDAGDPRPVAERFRWAPEIAVVDLDAALGRGSNAEVVHELLRIARCRVGGGIRDAASAIAWLDAGATRVVLGTAAVPEVLEQLPPERVIAALDAVDGEVVVHGWRTRTGRTVEERMHELRGLAGGFLVTFVEREGRLGGIDLQRAQDLAATAGDARLTVAGGIATLDEIAALDRLGIDAQVGMALYTGSMDLAGALTALLHSDRADGLWPTVVTDEQGRALGLVWSSARSLRAALESGRGVYESRTRGLWTKGETSGATQDLLRVDLDCDRDALRFTVRQHGSGFCHTEDRTCWGDDGGLAALARRLARRRDQAPAGSYTGRLLDDATFLRAKLIEEAGELADAPSRDSVAREAADVMYMALVAMARAGVPLADVESELDLRARRVTRRRGDAKQPIRREAPPLRRVPVEEVHALRRDAVDEVTLRQAADIVEDVRRRGETALREHAERLGDIRAGEPLVFERRDLEAALEALPATTRALLERTAERIRSFALAQRECIRNLDFQVAGGHAGHRIAPVERAGCYAPGGRHPLPSSVLMTVVTARAAGVEHVCVASPRPAPIVLAAAAVAGADALLAAGGAHAIAALAYGAGPLPACDVVVGPGNRWVTAAKQLVSGHVKIDLLAGPSELVVLADALSDAALVAADLLAQAEHDDDARPILVTTNEALADAVDVELERQLHDLPTAPTARRALAGGFAVIVTDLDAALDVCDRIAPEHLQIVTRDASEIAPRLRHYGALFIGPASAEVLGDYGIGPNHVLPTGGTARSTGGLSVLTFLRLRTSLQLHDPCASAAVATDAAALARLEGLEAHARAADRRLE